MPHVQVSEQTLAAVGFSRPRQANTFYPDDGTQTHVHLGVPSMVDDEIAAPGNRFVTYISIKIADQFYARLGPDPQTGLFARQLPQGKHWPDGFYDAVDALGILA
jgi:hypothetical protein